MGWISMNERDLKRIEVLSDVRTGRRTVAAAAAVLASPANKIETEKASNHRRWWNDSWNVIEPEGQPHATTWTREKNIRLNSFVAHAHARGLWIRFYMLDSASKAEQDANGWFAGYNFPSLDAARLRWIDCIRDGVDYLASDNYELVSGLVHKMASTDFKLH